MGAIDAHAHAFPDDLAARAVEKLQSLADWRAVGDGSVSGLTRSMDAAGIDLSLVCAIATRPQQAEGILAWCRQIRGERIQPFPSVHPDAPDACGCLERIAREGFAGVKLHPMYQGFAFDEARMERIYFAASRCGLIVAVHCGQDIAFPPPDDRASPRRLRRVIDKFPDLKLLCTHMGGWRQWRQSEECLIGSPVYLESSFSLDMLGAEKAIELIRRHGHERVLFGTDWPWADQGREIARLRSLGLSQQETQAVLSDNAERLLGR